MNIRRGIALALALSLPALVRPAASEQPIRIPFMDGLTTVRVSTSKVGDYETLRVVSGITATGYTTTTSGEAPADDGDGLIDVRVKRRVRMQDQLHSRNMRLAWHSTDRESMTGNVPGLSCDLFSELATQGKATLTYTDVRVNGDAGPLGFLDGPTQVPLQGTFTVVDRNPVALLVNRKRVNLPSLHVSGVLSGDGRQHPLDFYVLNDADNPLILGASFAGSVGRVLSIEFPPAEPQLERALAQDEVVELSGIYFSFAKADLRPESDLVLGQLANVLNAHMDWRFRIDGHTDSIGSDAANLDLSKRRAAAVRTALVERYDVAASQLTTEGYGETKPKETNDTDAGRARNRRVELVRQSGATPSPQVPADAPRPASASLCRKT